MTAGWNRIQESPRLCEQCGATMMRKRSAAGALESHWGFTLRRYCSSTCYGAARQHKFDAALPRRECVMCHTELRRYVWATGRKEVGTRFKRRKYCSRRCQNEAVRRKTTRDRRLWRRLTQEYVAL